MQFLRLMLVCFALASTSAAAQININDAAIFSGDLRISGRTLPNTRLVLDERFETTSNAQGLFQYRLQYLPSDCVATLTSGAQTRDVVISNCGPVGPFGPIGAAGPKGDAGPQGVTGAAGLRGDAGPQGVA